MHGQNPSTSIHTFSDHPAADVTGMLLAAGYARRFGSDKRQHPWPGGPTLMEAALHPLIATCGHVIVVLPPGDAWGLKLCQRYDTSTHIDIRIAWSFNRSAGLAASLSAAMPLVRRNDSQAIVVALADMGNVQASTTAALIAAWRKQPERPALPVHGGQPGNPRLIPLVFFPNIQRLTGDDGVRRAVDWTHAQHIEVEDPGVLHDLDGPPVVQMR